MNEDELPPDGRAVEVYLALLRVRMPEEDYERLLDVVTPVLRTIEEQGMPSADLPLESARAQGLPQEIRDEAALVIATAVTGRLDNELVVLDIEETGPVRVVTDAASAADPARLTEIADYIRDRHRETEELRGIAEASGMPADF
ncbi:hypothetical protein STXM2123_4118 [Streptomyces sp. F-3]|jgi:hypothetical protein|uniref:Uncharacterized protein n=1 Tax=Streptomyces thermogriseus TaxID=75292 RepID=A0ABN1T1M2_9ACTN|nr:MULTISPECIES: hypothetical protein [Streptomyces]MDN5381944.1 hypothetical protein [Streptomyces sp. LB8]GAT83417.1 hypothetical protein STXM2123_4118 [Streptomyces sp. F-3]